MLGLRLYLIRLLFPRDANFVIERQRQIIVQQQRELQEVAIEHTSTMLELAVAWRIAIEQPEVDVRDSVSEIIRELQDSLARLQEHAA